jgi:hypothetical protein
MKFHLKLRSVALLFRVFNAVKNLKIKHLLLANFFLRFCERESERVSLLLLGETVVCFVGQNRGSGRQRKIQNVARRMIKDKPHMQLFLRKSCQNKVRDREKEKERDAVVALLS